MGHNISSRKRSSLVMTSPLADFRGWNLEIDCGGPQCARGRTYDVGGLAGVYKDRTVAGALHRMRCSSCRRAPVLARLIPRGEVELRRTGAICLIGPGSN
jgi:hypothetical protein